jgi:hypothetical protein
MGGGKSDSESLEREGAGGEKKKVSIIKEE